jgi:hypothetical protein
VFEELAERTGDDDRAYEMAGMTLADHRMLAAFKAMHEAGEQLARCARTLPTVQRILVIGAAMCADLPEAANDWRDYCICNNHLTDPALDRN